MSLLCVVFAGAALAGERAEPVETPADAWPTPPGQPASGPGGSDYAYDRVRVRRYGQGADTYWLFEPADAEPGEKRPVVLYVHGLNLPHYGVSWLWIKHLVRRGNLVVYPQYQQGAIVDPRDFTATTAKAMRDALKRMDGQRHAEPDHERFAIIGHSVGGVIALNLAARPEHYGLPSPKALMPIQPGDTRAKRGLGALLPSITEDHATVAPGTLMLIVASTNDAVVGRRFAEQMYRQTVRIKPRDKDLLLMSDDTRGRPALTADHFMPLAYNDRTQRRRANAYDFALWRWFDALSSAAFYDGKHRGYALGDTETQRAMGQWSDGRAVREPLVLDLQPREAAGGAQEAQQAAGDNAHADDQPEASP